MKITEVSVTLWRWKEIPFTRYTKSITSQRTGQTTMGLVRIESDERHVGHSFLGSALGSAERDAQSLIDSLKPILMGQDPLARERLWQWMMRRTRNSLIRAIGAVDVALWDLAGMAAGVPIYRLIGSFRDRVPAYASSMVFDTPEDYATEALHHKATGWSAYKIHPPAIPELDIKICQACREAVGPDYRLMLDSTWSYDYPNALRVGKAIEELDFYWYEDPLAEDDIYNYVKLKQLLRIPIMATEFPASGPTSYAPWVTAQATDYLRGDVALKGGITSCLKTARLAESFRMNYEVHHGGNSLNNVANLHLILAIPNCEYFEVLLPAEAQKHGLVQDIDVDETGNVYAFDEPGLGAQIDFDLIEANTIAVLR